jgi:hypothetical protein
MPVTSRAVTPPFIPTISHNSICSTVAMCARQFYGQLVWFSRTFSGVRPFVEGVFEVSLLDSYINAIRVKVPDKPFLRGMGHHLGQIKASVCYHGG